MIHLKDYIIKESNNNISKLEEVIRKNNEDKLKFNVTNDMIIIIGEKNEDQTDFETKVLSLLKRSKFNLKENNLDVFEKINKDKCPLYYIADKKYLDSIKKDLENV